MADATSPVTPSADPTPDTALAAAPPAPPVPVPHNPLINELPADLAGKIKEIAIAGCDRTGFDFSMALIDNSNPEQIRALLPDNLTVKDIDFNHDGQPKGPHGNPTYGTEELAAALTAAASWAYRHRTSLKDVPLSVVGNQAADIHKLKGCTTALEIYVDEMETRAVTVRRSAAPLFSRKAAIRLTIF